MKWRDLRSEVDAHIEEEALNLIESGVPEQEAWARARRAFGNATQVAESSRAVWVWTWLEHLAQDLRYALRAMASNRMFTLLAVTSLALGIGANTAIFSFMDAILLRSLPVDDPQSLVVLKFRRPGASQGKVSGKGSRGKMAMHATSGGNSKDGLSIFPFPAFEMFQKRSDLFDSVFSYFGQTETRLTVNRQATLGDCVYVSGDYFGGLGTRLSAGRVLTGEDDRFGAPPVAMISAGFAQQWYGSPADAVGKAISVNGVSFTVVGVAPPGFFGVNPLLTPEIYVPLHGYPSTQPTGPEDDRFTAGGMYWLDVMARLKPGVTREQAQAALDPVFAEYFRQNSGETPEKARMKVMEGAGGLDSLRLRYAQPLYVLMAMVVLILTIACANIANLLLARASARRREIAVRLSMGASRFRVIRQLLTESLLLSAAGGLLGLLIAQWGVRALTALLAEGREDFTLRAGLNWPVLAVTFALAIATGVIFGLVPAWQATKVDVYPALKESRSSIGPPRRGWLPLNLGQMLIAGQITLSFLLLIGAGLFVRTLSKLQSLELGFNRENVLLMEINTQQSGYESPAALAFHETLRQRFERIPGVINATLAVGGQLDGGTWSLQFAAPGSLTQGNIGAPLLPVGPNYLTTMQIPILLGRDISAADGNRKPIAAVISQSFAKKHFGADNPLGRRLTMTFEGVHELEVVGVAKNARYGELKEDPPEMLYVDYRHNANFSRGMIQVMARTGGDPAQVANAARTILREADPGVPPGRIYTQAAQIDNTINQEIIFARLCTIFAVLAVLIACVGLYGTTVYNVARRTSEIGIRMALGARSGNVLAMVMKDVAVVGLVGLVIGVPVALGTSKLLALFLFGLQPNDPVTIVAAIAILLAACLVAAYGPARRASRIDPMTALRHE